MFQITVAAKVNIHVLQQVNKHIPCIVIYTPCHVLVCGKQYLSCWCDIIIYIVIKLLCTIIVVAMQAMRHACAQSCDCVQ